MGIDFSSRSFGKWILAGEHAVLRGCPALVFPISSRFLDLEYRATRQDLELILQGDHGNELQLLIWGVLEKACELKGLSRSQLKGQLVLTSSIPVGAGMGASAALCVALTRWLGFLGFVAESDYYEFARQLENMFHGESSGVDIAVALSGQPLRFVRDGARELFTPLWQPQWYISYSGQRGVTLECVNKVKALIAAQPELGAALDEQMRQAVELAQGALLKPQAEGWNQLLQAISLADECFERWGLSEGAPQTHMQWLREQGAIAVKPTGSGGGGYVLSLWTSEPKVEVKKLLVKA